VAREPADRWNSAKELSKAISARCPELLFDAEERSQFMRELFSDRIDQTRKLFELSKAKYLIAYEKFMAHPADDVGYYNPLRLLPTLKFKPWQTLYAHLDEHFHDDRVSYAFSYPSKYLGLHPTTCSSVFGVIPFLELAFGVWHVMGGFRALAAGMMKCAQDLGATFRMSSPVDEVLVENGEAKGVRLASGEVLKADLVVVNADLPYAAQRLIPEKWREGSRLSNACALGDR